MMSEQLDTTANAMTNNFAETAVRVTSQVNEANTLMVQRLERTSNEVTSQLDSAGSTIFAKIDNTSRELGQRFEIATHLLERVRASCRANSMEPARALPRSSTAPQARSSPTWAGFAMHSRRAGQTTLQITGRLEQDSGLLVDRIDRATRELEQASVTTSVKLDDAHRKFAKHVETANTYLADQLSAAASGLDERLETISMHLTGKLEMTGARVSERLDDVTQLVEKSIDKLNDEMERVLVNRKSRSMA